MNLEQTKQSIIDDNYEISLHAIERALEREIWKEDRICYNSW